MNYDTVENLIKSRVNTILSVPLQFENVEFTKPDVTTVTWASVTIRWAREDGLSFGGPLRSRGMGMLVVRIFSPIGMGLTPGNAVAVTLMDALRTKTFDGVRYKLPEKRDEGIQGDVMVISVVFPILYEFTHG